MLYYLLFFTLPLMAQTSNWLGCGPTYGSKIGLVCGVQFAIPGNANQFDIYEVKINAHAIPTTTVGFGLSKSMFNHVWKNGWSFDLMGLTTVGTTATSTATTASFTGGFLPTLHKNHFAISFGFIAQSGAAKGNLYGIPIGYVP